MDNPLRRFLAHPIWTVLGVVVAVVALWFTLPQAPTNTNSPPPTITPVVNPNDSKPTPTPSASPPPERSPSPQPSPSLPQPSSPPASSIASPINTERPRIVSNQPSNIDNDIGKSKKNDFYEITVENARTSTDRVRFDTCNFDVPPGQKAVLVRFGISWSPSKSVSAEEQFHLSAVKSSDFLLVDDRNRRIDTACQYAVLLLNIMARTATTRTLAYLVRSDATTLTFRFQKAGGGEAITFDLSGLD
jgi:hypothetical protein